MIRNPGLSRAQVEALIASLGLTQAQIEALKLNELTVSNLRGTVSIEALSVSGATSLKGAVAFKSSPSVVEITEAGPLENWAPAPVSLLTVKATVESTLGGLYLAQIAGQTVTILLVEGSKPLKLIQQSPGSEAANKFHMNIPKEASLTLVAGQMITFQFVRNAWFLVDIGLAPRAAAIAAPEPELASLVTAVNALRAAVKNANLTA